MKRLFILAALAFSFIAPSAQANGWSIQEVNGYTQIAEFIDNGPTLIYVCKQNHYDPRGELITGLHQWNCLSGGYEFLVECYTHYHVDFDDSNNNFTYRECYVHGFNAANVPAMEVQRVRIGDSLARGGVNYMPGIDVPPPGGRPNVYIGSSAPQQQQGWFC